MALPEVNAQVSVDNNASVFAALQDRVIRGEKLSESDIVNALFEDLRAGRALSEVFLSKFIVGNTRVSVEAIGRILSALQTEMSATLLSSPDLFVLHSRAAALLARDLRRRQSHLHVVK
jgi:hypothetical protein